MARSDLCEGAGLRDPTRRHARIERRIAGAGAPAIDTPGLLTRCSSGSTTSDSAGQANDAVNGMLNGNGDVHTAMIALQRADTMLELTVQYGTSWCRPIRTSCGCRCERAGSLTPGTHCES